MEKMVTKRALSIILSFLTIISVISFPTIKAKATGTVDDFVERCYTVTLGRGSDPDGFADWKGQLLNGKAVGVHVAYGFLFSPEYTKKNKSNKEYVTDLYMLFMGREPDEDGFNDWVGQLEAGKSRVEVFAGFANSQEFYNICESYGITAGRFVAGNDRNQVNNVNLFVERLYKITLGRIGDKDGQKNWVEQLIKKQITGSECARRFIFSQEYTNKGLSDEEFVENLYLAMMGRASDPEGKTNWVNGLANGMTRDEVFAGFANSIEFANICNTYKIDRGAYTAKDIGSNNNKNNNKENEIKKPSGYKVYLGDDSYAGYYKFIYDLDGNKVKEEEYSVNGELVRYWEYLDFDEHGSYKKFHYVPVLNESENGEELWEEYNYEYNTEGIIKTKKEIADSHYIIYEYDERGIEIKYTVYNLDDSVRFYTTSIPKYDSNGKLMYVERFSNGELDYRIEYDEKEREICSYTYINENFYQYVKTTYDNDGKEHGSTVYTYEDGVTRIESYWIYDYEQ